MYIIISRDENLVLSICIHTCLPVFVTTENSLFRFYHLDVFAAFDKSSNYFFQSAMKVFVFVVSYFMWFSWKMVKLTQSTPRSHMTSAISDHETFQFPFTFLVNFKYSFKFRNRFVLRLAKTPYQSGTI